MSHHAHCLRTPHRRVERPERVPRGGIDPILHPLTALALFQVAVSKPAKWETIVVPLDHRFTGSAVIYVDHTGPNASMTAIAERFAEALTGRAHGLLIATSRPYGCSDSADSAEWFAASDATAKHGCELIEWFILGSEHAWLPRVAAGGASKWPER